MPLPSPEPQPSGSKLHARVSGPDQAASAPKGFYGGPGPS